MGSSILWRPHGPCCVTPLPREIFNQQKTAVRGGFEGVRWLKFWLGQPLYLEPVPPNLRAGPPMTEAILTNHQ